MIPLRKITEITEIEMIGVYDYVHHFVGANPYIEFVEHTFNYMFLSKSRCLTHQFNMFWKAISAKLVSKTAEIGYQSWQDWSANLAGLLFG